jgi:hypothetical protein
MKLARMVVQTQSKILSFIKVFINVTSRRLVCLFFVLTLKDMVIEANNLDHNLPVKHVKTSQIGRNGQFWSWRPKILASCLFLKVMTTSIIVLKYFEDYFPVKHCQMGQTGNA